METAEQSLTRFDKTWLARKAKISAALNALPIGTTINGYTLTNLGGDLFWLGPKMLTSYQLYESFAKKVTYYLGVDRYNWADSL